MKKRKRQGHKNAGNFRSIRRRYGHAKVQRTHAYNVRLHGKLIETVWQNSPWPNKTEREGVFLQSRTVVGRGVAKTLDISHGNTSNCVP